MSNAKKILLIIGAILLVAVISTVVGWSLAALSGLSFWAWFILITTIQLCIPYFHEKYTFTKEIQTAIKDYAAKPFRKYEIPLTCQYCGHKQPVDVDLTETTYTCSECERRNAVYVTFNVAAITNE